MTARVPATTRSNALPSPVEGLGPRRHRHDEVAAVGAVAQRALAVGAAARLVMRLALERLQVAQRVVADQHDGAAATAVAAVGAAARNVRLAAEGLQPFPPAPPCTKMRALS